MMRPPRGKAADTGRRDMSLAEASGARTSEPALVPDEVRAIRPAGPEDAGELHPPRVPHDFIRDRGGFVYGPAGARVANPRSSES